jgi:hypothetical protein
VPPAPTGLIIQYVDQAGIPHPATDSDNDGVVTINVPCNVAFSYPVTAQGGGQTQNATLTAAKIQIDAIALPNNFVALPDWTTWNTMNGWNPIPTFFSQATYTDMKVTYSILPTGFSFDKVSLEMSGQCVEGVTKTPVVRTFAHVLTHTSGPMNEEIVPVQLDGSYTWTIAVDPTTLNVSLKAVDGKDIICASSVTQKEGRRLLYVVNLDPAAYRNKPVCPYTDKHTVPGSSKEFYGLLITYYLGANLVDWDQQDSDIVKMVQGTSKGLTITIEGGPTLNVLAAMKKKGGRWLAKWEGLLVEEPAGEPYFLDIKDFQSDKPSGDTAYDKWVKKMTDVNGRHRAISKVVPHQVAREGGYYMTMTAEAAPDPANPSLKQKHTIEEIPVRVEYDTRVETR